MKLKIISKTHAAIKGPGYYQTIIPGDTITIDIREGDINEITIFERDIFREARESYNNKQQTLFDNEN